jgi:hypothetical protein
MVSIEHVERERIELEEPKECALWYHWHMNQDVPILTIKQQGRFDLEEVRVVLDQEVAPGLVCLGRQLSEQSHQLGQVQVVDGEPLVHGGLDGVSDPMESSPELILQSRQLRVKQSRVEHDLV